LRVRRAAGGALVVLGAALLLAACGPTNRRDEVNATPTPTVTATPTATATPTPTTTPDATRTPQFRQAFVRVVGTAGTPFVGQILDGSGGRSVDGVIPEDFVLGTPRSFVSASFSKTEAGLATITAQIFVDGVLTAEQSTTTNFGSVTVNAPLP
jgi:hypothetical protein